jgi:hypothetical protein
MQRYRLEREPMKRLYLLALCAITAGCEPPRQRTQMDQCIRAELFERCLSKTPTGPVNTKYNDWAEVLDECGTWAQYHSHRLTEHVPPECRSAP